MQGHVRQRKSKKWSYVFELGSIDGKRKQKEVGGFETKKEAHQALRKAITEYEKGVYQVDKDISLSEFIDYWIENHAEVSLRYSTRIRYINIIDAHIKPALGAYRLRKLNHLILQRFLTSKHKAGYAYGTLNNMSAILSGSFKHAIAWGFLNNNPMETVSIPKKVTNNEIRPLAPDDVDKIYNHYKDTKYILPFLIALYSGMRVGEVLGLTWNNIDFKTKTIYITHILQKQYNKWVLVNTKTKSSVRSIVMSDFLYNELTQRKINQDINKSIYKGFYNDNDFVCVGKNGGIVHLDHLSYFTRKINKELGIKFRFHDLRHTFASNMLKLGVHPKVVQEILGHTSIATTLNTYSHLTPNLHTDAMSQLTDYMNEIMPTN